MKIQIEISGSCHNCPCHKIVEGEATYHLCKGFNRVLLTQYTTSYNRVFSEILRCQDCVDAEISEEIKEDTV